MTFEELVSQITESQKGNYTTQYTYNGLTYSDNYNIPEGYIYYGYVSAGYFETTHLGQDCIMSYFDNGEYGTSYGNVQYVIGEDGGIEYITLDEANYLAMLTADDLAEANFTKEGQSYTTTNKNIINAFAGTFALEIDSNIAFTDVFESVTFTSVKVRNNDRLLINLNIDEDGIYHVVYSDVEGYLYNIGSTFNSGIESALKEYTPATKALDEEYLDILNQESLTINTMAYTNVFGQDEQGSLQLLGQLPIANFKVAYDADSYEINQYQYVITGEGEDATLAVDYESPLQTIHYEKTSDTTVLYTSRAYDEATGKYVTQSQTLDKIAFSELVVPIKGIFSNIDFAQPAVPETANEYGYYGIYDVDNLFSLLTGYNMTNPFVAISAYSPTQNIPFYLSGMTNPYFVSLDGMNVNIAIDAFQSEFSTPDPTEVDNDITTNPTIA